MHVRFARLRPLVAAVAVLALLAGGLARGAGIAAQGDDGASAPLIGTPVSIIGTDGVEVARVTVTGIEDPWEEFEEGSEPPQSYRYVVLGIEIENTGARPYPIGSFGIGLQDSEGFLALPTFIPRTTEQVEADPDLTFDDVPPGDTVAGVVTYQVLESAELVRVTYQPAYDRLIFLADLTQNGSPSATDDDEDAADDADAEGSPVAGDAGAEDGDGAASGEPGDGADQAAEDNEADSDADADEADADADDADEETAAVDVSDEDCDAIQDWLDDIDPALVVFGATFEDLAATDPVTAADLEDAAADLRDAADQVRDSDPPDLIGDASDLLADAMDAYADAYLDAAESNDEISASDFFSTVDTSAADELLTELDTLTADTFEACGIDA